MDQSEEPEITPLFCLKTFDKKVQRNLFINFKSSDDVQEPEIDVDEDQLVREICNPSPNIENYKIPLKLSQIYWTKNDNKSDLGYVIDAQLNDKFAIRKVIASEIIRHYVITVAILTIEEKYNNNAPQAKAYGQFLGHKLELDQNGYEIIKSKLFIERSNELVNNKVIFADDTPISETSTSGQLGEDTPYELHYRPNSKLLTCSLNTDRLPDSISFNDDRFYVELDGKCLIDVYLPFFIDLKQPVKYKFDDRSCLLRIVFNITESTSIQ